MPKMMKCTSRNNEYSATPLFASPRFSAVRPAPIACLLFLRCPASLLAPCLVFLLATPAGRAESSPDPSATVLVRPADTGEALANPQMGWVLHHYDNIIENYGSKLEPSDTVDDFPGVTVVYLRLPWSFLEPEEGEFVWSMVDAPAQRWIDKGRQVAFRFSCSESWIRYATPKWVQDAGAKGYNFSPDKGVVDNGPFWEPDYADPVFLGKLDGFLAAAAARYDGNSNVAFIDVGSFGVWGEGHTFASSHLKYPAEVVVKHIDVYLKHFKKTLLAANDDFSFQGEERPIRYALERGLTLRDDSILVQPPPNSYFHAGMAQAFWHRLPVILESEHYGPSKGRGAWGDGSLYLKAVEEYHASYASVHWWPREFLRAEGELVRKISLRLGYRIQLRQASWPKAISRKGALVVSTAWANAGVAPCYPGGHPAFTLSDAKGGIAAVFADSSFDVRELAVGPPGEAPVKSLTSTFRIAPNLAPGTYAVLVSVGMADGTPRIALPLAESGGHRRYRLGVIEVSE